MQTKFHLVHNSLLRLLIRRVMRAAFASMRLWWLLTRPKTRGASAFCFTPEGSLVLVYSTYEVGWNLPSGGISGNEPAELAIIRELKEEIGLISSKTPTFLGEFSHHPNFKNDTESVFIVRDVLYRPKFNFEIEVIGEFPMSRLPGDISLELKIRLARFMHALRTERRLDCASST